jgi:hypothetical protein
MIDVLEQELRASLPHNLGQWSNELATVAFEYRDNYEEARDFAKDLAAIMDRESGGGIFLHPQNQTGVGDRTPRHGVLPHWGGWGLGLMQIDAQHEDLANLVMEDGTPAWQNALENIRMGANEYQTHLNEFDQNKEHAFCAYNAGYKRVKHQLDNGLDPNAVTTPGPHSPHKGDYGRDVLARRQKFGV